MLEIIVATYLFVGVIISYLLPLLMAIDISNKIAEYNLAVEKEEFLK